MPESLARSNQEVSLALYNSDDFFTALVQDIAVTKSGDRIGLTTMSFEPAEPIIDNLMRELHAAAERQVEITMGVDAYTFLVDSTSNSLGPLLLPLPFHRDVYRRRHASLDDLNNYSSSQVSILNQPTHPLSNPFAGRSHIKTAIINDKVYVMGPNLHEIHRSDMVVGFTDTTTADQLYDVIQTLVKTGSTQETFGDTDRIWQLDSNTKLIIDAGVPAQSTILGQAIELIDNETSHLTMSSQFFPRGVVARHLASAIHRQVAADVFFNHPHAQGGLGSLPEKIAIARARHWLPPQLLANELQPDQHTHARGIAGTTRAIVGTHNLDPRGVAFGTAEVSIVRDDVTFAGDVAAILHALNQPRADKK